MKCPSCGHSWQAERTAKPAAAEKSTAEMSTAELYAFYKRTSHIGDVRFFVEVLTGAGHQAIANQAIVLLTEAEHGLPRAEVLRRLARLQESWRTHDQPAGDEARFWRKCRQLGAKERGREYREMRDRLISRIQNVSRGMRYNGMRCIDPEDWQSEQSYVIRDVIKLAHAARELCPTILAVEAA